MLVTFFPWIKDILTHIPYFGSILSFNVIVIFYLIVQNEFLMYLFENIKIIRGDSTLLNDKHISQYDFSIFSTILGAKIGFMMRDTHNEWSYYSYLIIYFISSINQQIGLFSNHKKKFIFCIMNIWKKDQNLEWKVNERTLNQKLIVGRRFTSLFLIYVIFISYFITGQWIHFYRYNLSCTFDISSAFFQSMKPHRIIIFISISTVIDLICFLYHKGARYKNVIYYKKNNIFVANG